MSRFSSAAAVDIVAAAAGIVNNIPTTIKAISVDLSQSIGNVQSSNEMCRFRDNMAAALNTKKHDSANIANDMYVSWRMYMNGLKFKLFEHVIHKHPEKDGPSNWENTHSTCCY